MSVFQFEKLKRLENETDIDFDKRLDNALEYASTHPDECSDINSVEQIYCDTPYGLLCINAGISTSKYNSSNRYHKLSIMDKIEKFIGDWL